MNKPPSNPSTFEQERPLMPGHDTVSTLHWPKMTIWHFSNFCRKKVSWLDKKSSCTFCIVLEVLICKNHGAKPLDSFNMYRKYIHHVEKLFSAEILKIPECYFWADVLLRQSRLWASRASPDQKLRGLTNFFD